MTAAGGPEWKGQWELGMAGDSVLGEGVSQVGNTGAQEAVRTPVTVLHKISTKNAYVHVKWPGTNGRPDLTKPRVGQQEIRAEPRQQEQMHP